MNDITRCKGLFCPVKDDCIRYNIGPIEDGEPYFSKPPFNNSKCDFFWGEQSQFIFNQLKDIVNGDA